MSLPPLAPEHLHFIQAQQYCDLCEVVGVSIQFEFIESSLNQKNQNLINLSIHPSFLPRMLFY
jgi:hypothetical protein